MALLDAVEEVWLTQGDMALTIRRLGTEAGTTTQAVYSYFGSMNALYNAAYTRAEHDIATTADTATSLADCVHYAHQHPARWHMIVTGNGPNNQSSPKLLHARHQLHHLAGSPTTWAILTGLIAAEQRHELTTTQVLAALASPP